VVTRHRPRRDVPEFYEATDGWRGLTVLWVKLNVGGNKSRAERWPATPPEVNVDGNWSLLWDPRDPAQDADDPATWTFSKNQALATLDALRQNPLRPYDQRNLWTETFEWAADAADEAVAVKGGGTIPRYEANGILVFSDGAELEDQVQPLADAGASRFMRVGGKLGLVPAVWSEPVATVTDMLGDQPMVFNRYRESSELLTAVTARYISPLRAYEDASTPVYTIDGAQAEDGGGEKLGTFDLRFVTDHRQAQRVAKIFGMRTRMQRSLNGVLPPTGFNLVAGSPVAVDLPVPYHLRNGNYEVEEIQPGASPVGSEDGSVAMICPATLRETSPAIYAWDAETEEKDVAVEDFDPEVGSVKVPGAITLVSDPTTIIVSGDVFIPRIRFSFDPSPSSSVISYEWQFRKGSDLWQSGNFVDAESLDGIGDIFGYLLPVEDGGTYTIRARAVAPIGASEFVESDPITVTVDPVAPQVLDSFTVTSPAPHLGNVAFAFRTKNDAHAWKVDLYRVAAGAAFDPTLLTPVHTEAVSASTTYAHIDGDPTRVEEIVGGNMANSADWPTQVGGASVTGGKAVHTPGTSGSVRQPKTLTPGETYRYEFTITGSTAGVVGLQFLGGTSAIGTTQSANAKFRGTLVALAGNNTVALVFNAASDASVDDFRMYKRTATCAPAGDWDYYAVPRNISGIIGPASGPLAVAIT
jgi:hypothetical protein